MITLDFEKQLLGAQGTITLQMHCSLKPQDLITLFGKSGAGKTTILRILAGLLEPDFGRVQIGDSIWYEREKGAKKARINLPPQMRSIGFVFQNYALFPNMSVEENLNFALPKGASRTKVKELLEITELQALAKQKPLSLSGGQQQRILIARAIISKPSILFFDEATSALDNVSQKQVSENLDRMGCTRVIIAHRLSTIRHCDRIIVLDKGVIVEEGTFDELREKGGLFADLMKRQML